MSEVWTIGKVVRWAADDFRARGIESPRLEAELLLAHALGLDRMKIIVEQDRPLSPEELARYRDLIKRRRAREPVAYIRGEREFWGRPFRVDRRVLIPRPDTEALVETALRRTVRLSMSGRALDLCTGSGCVATTFALERPGWTVTGSDLSPDAIAVARDNAARLGAVWNVRWLEGDLFEPVGEERFDLVTANPPYIAEGEAAALSPDIRDHEPHLALFGGPRGLDVTARIVAEAPRHLRPGGVLALEIGAGQADDVAAMLERAGLSAIERTRDYGGHDRVVSAVFAAG
jgi:release factor glutamine methyltransferase